MAGRIQARLVVSGLVQGVYYRESARLMAEAVGAAGWVRNLPDGTVEAVFEGPPDAVARAVDFCRTGPPDARVDRVDVVEGPPEGLDGFEIRPTPGR